MTSPENTSSSSVPPHSRRTFSERISAVGAKINRALSSEGRPSQNGYNAETESIASTVVEGNGRSGSRGRDSGYHSSGRGGAGNFHATPTNANGEVQEFPWPRGRERAPVSQQAAPGVRSTGRGGSGNFSQSPPATDLSYSLRDRELMRAHAETEKNAPRSSGRGGIGNIVNPNSRSRSRSTDPVSSPTSMPVSPVRTRGPGYTPSPPRDRQVNGIGHGQDMNANGTRYGT
ncbi:hypothetical protein DFH07DRAFT_972731 [Mycena maculata]|uniref:Uncharacterized protein n=1 Tax=Mycena maculata TaxID=230809 RepID=A0AAD7HGX9_9AGAR|nr:hypothetical protein DFH07DRAFT_972731 [Mycena maculata]